VTRRWWGLLVAAMVASSVPAVAASLPVPAQCALAAAPRGEWRSYGHDLANTRFQDAEHDIGPLQAATLAPVWTFSSTAAGGEGDFTGTPVVADGCLFVASNRGWVFALNADDGRLVWKARLPAGGVSSSVAVDAGRVIVAVSNDGKPYLAARRESDGAALWTTPPIDRQPGADVYGSPTVFDGLVFEGVSGGSAELAGQQERYAFHGAFVLVDAATGRLLRKTWTIPPDQWAKGYAGATVWSSPAIDPATRTAYVGTGNPFQPQRQSARADAVLKIDLNRASRIFGQVLGRYDGTAETYTGAASRLPCYDIPGNPPPYYPQGAGSCAQMDLDFGASPNLFHDARGRLLVGEGQKSGVYHAFDAATLRPAWHVAVGPPSSVGGIVGSTATDGYQVYGPVTSPGYLWSLTRAGGARWLAPIGDGAHWGNPVSVADGVVYTVDLRGFLDGYDAITGAPVLQRPLVVGSQVAPTWGGVSIARGTVYAAVGITSLADGLVVAFRPGGGGGGGLGPAPALPRTPNGMVVVAGPGAEYSTYATPAVVVRAGAALSFSNADLPQHDVVAVDLGHDGRPLFRSKLVGLGEVTPVAGVEHLRPGQYAFTCSIHPGMKGTLVVTG
jgi:polyvinyl alcohol dehydrogenase (cytochrome)